MYKKLTEAQLRKAIDDALGKEDTFVTQVSPNLFRVGMGNGNPPMYTSRSGILELNKAIREEFERQYGKKDD